MRRVVVTGLGAVTPLGVGIRRTWSSLLDGRCGITNVADRHPRFAEIPAQIASVVPSGTRKDGGWTASEWLSRDEERKMARFAQFAMAATEEALADAAWRPTSDEQREATGVCLGSGIGNFDQIYNTVVDFENNGYKKVSPLFVPKLLINLGAGHISMRYGFMGPNHAVTTACTTGAHSIGDAARFIAFGDADVMVTGGAESCIHPLALGGFARARSLATNFNENPTKASRPFDADRQGFVVGEGAAVMVLEELEHARARGAHIYAEFKGYGTSGDAFHITAPKENGAGALAAMRKALKHANIPPSAVDYVNAHATSTVVGDAAENAAIKALLLDSTGGQGKQKPSDINVSSTKGAIGHLLGGAGAIEAIFSILAIHENIMPPTINLETQTAEFDCNYAANEAQERKIDIVLTNSFGFGGTNRDSLIAINYAARPFGITRMLSAIEAKKRCPELVLQHVATFREGEGGKWAYRDDASCKIKTDKVSLDPYRAQSRRILSTIKEEVSRQRGEIINSKGVPLEFQAAKIEKASVDEVFLDLSSLVYAVLYQRYPELRRTPTTSDKTTPLPSPPTTALEWFPEDGLVDLDEEETEEDDPDWDDVAMLIGAEITRSIRAAIWDKLSYTCSAGIARNKMMSKLGSAQNKPNKQTVIRNRAIQKFLGGFQFTKIRWLGGKLGERISAEFGTEQVKELLNVSLEQFKAKLDDDTAVWVYNIIRGIDDSEVNPRTQIKSMLSAKSFRPSINSADQARKWLRIFAADLYNRLVEDGLLENKRRPTTLSLHHRMGGQVHSKSTPIPGGKMVTEDILYDLSSNLLNQVIAEARAWPCANLSVNVTGFEEGPVNNRAIDSFFTPGQSKPLAEPSLPKKVAEPLDDEERPTKVRKVAAKGIGSFFKRDSPSLVNSDNDKDIDDRSPPLFSTADIPTTKSPQDNDITIPETHEETSNQLYDGTITCPRCNEQVPEDQREEHDDWHFAKDLDAQEVRADQTSRNIAEQSSRHTASDHKKTGPGRPRAAAPKTEKGQKRLFFG